MLNAMFGFGGRVNRLQYFLGRLALLGAVIGLAVLVFGMMGFHAPRSVSQALALAVLAGVLGALALTWIAYSLDARRYRDMGWNPLVCILGLFGLNLVSQILALPSLHAGDRHPAPLVIVGLVNLAMGGCLLFWPSNDGQPTPSAGRPKSAPPERPVSAPPRAAVAAAAPAWNAVQSRTSFGRRGL